MKSRLSVLACGLLPLLASSPALATPAVVQSVTTHRVNTTTQTLSSANMTTTAGNALVIYAAEYQPDTSFDGTTPVTDGAGNTYVQALAENTDTVSKTKIIVYYCLNCAALSGQP